MTSLDIGRPAGPEPESYGGASDGLLLLYAPAVVLVFLLLSPAACPARWEIEVAVTEWLLTVEARAGRNFRVPLREITDISLEPTMPRVRRGHRTSASESGWRRGRFTVAELGDGWLYTTADSPPYIVVRTVDAFVILNFPSADRTRALYRELTAAWRGGA